MPEEKQKIHCLHVCGHLDAMMEEASFKQEAIRKQSIKPPISCDTNEDSDELHEMYKDRVRGTEPSEEKKKMMIEWMQSIEQAQLAHSLILVHAKQEEIGLKRHASTLSHMHNDDSDSEGEGEDAMNDTPSDTQKTDMDAEDQAANTQATDNVQTDQTNNSQLADADTTRAVISATETEKGAPEESGGDVTNQ